MVKQMKKNIVLIMTLAVFTLASCNDPVFYTISQETPLQKPRIDGSPSKFVEFDGAMYVATGKSLYYYKDNKWDRVVFQDWIRDIAATAEYFYVCIENSAAMLLRTNKIDSNTNWDSIQSDNLNVQKIFGVDNVLYISSITGTSTGNFPNYSIHNLLDSSTTLQEVSTGTNNVSMLCGVAGSGANVYLCSVFDNTDRNNIKGGIFHTTAGSSAAALVPGSFVPSVTPDTPIIQRFTGIISLGTTPDIIAAVSYIGELFKVTPSGIGAPVARFEDSRRTTGALGVWKDVNNPSSILLLVGRQDVGYSYNTGFAYGYVELKLSDTDITGIAFFEPGKDIPTTVENHERYISSLGKNPVNYIHQASEDGILFASTQYRGVWSYRERNGVLQWNAEE